MRRHMIVILTGLLVGGAAAAQAEWLSLGQRALDPRDDRTRIEMRGRAWCDAIVLGVDDAAVRIVEVKVALENGSVIDWPLRGIVYPGQRTQVFDLPGHRARRVRWVSVWYETGHAGRRGQRVHREQANEREWERSWDRDWDRDYGQLKPVVTIWAHQRNR